jgi:3-phosphoshikimate 1-carboxyvinyltransferase
MSAEIDFPKGEGLPVHIHGKPLQGKDISLPVVSAQIKSALLLAGLYAEGITNVIEATPTRDHTERMLKAFGASVGFDLPKTFTYELPGDISSAAFLIVVAILCKQNITLANVGLNPTRKRFLDIMIACGLQVSLPHNVIEHGEERATLEIAGSSFLGFNGYTFTREDIALCIDEIPAMAVLAAFFDGKTLFRNANELRRKESDRISSIAENLMRAGVGVEEFDDGFSVLGCNERQIGSCVLDSFGDHRIAMAVSVLALRAREAVTIRNAEVVSISFPNFFHELVRIVGKERIIKA